MFFWHEADRRQGEGWHIAVDAKECDDLEGIVGLALGADHPARFAFPTASGALGMTALAIAFDAALPADHWRPEERHPVRLVLGVNGLKSLRAATLDMRNGDGDYCIGPDAPDQRVWVWWPPRPLVLPRPLRACDRVLVVGV